MGRASRVTRPAARPFTGRKERNDGAWPGLCRDGPGGIRGCRWHPSTPAGSPRFPAGYAPGLVWGLVAGRNGAGHSRSSR
ncbi:hypothetical protein [Parascardovia denticolens]|uniref:hypothetical protein n=1 Tax=Parascardovia denticolens TaxID=78258 RepID=UPI0012FD2EC8|nr:hypothetical protein [Parascardovia denticolens]